MSLIFRCLVTATFLLPSISLAQTAQVNLPDVGPEFSVTVESRLQMLEETNRQFAEQLQAVQADNDALTAELQQMSARQLQLSSAFTDSASVDIPPLDQVAALDRWMEQPPDVRTDQPPSKMMLEGEEKNPFQNPFVWKTKDGEWTLQMHNETQIDIRAYGTAHSSPVNQVGFYIPRMRIIFNGNLSKPIEYQFGINKGLGDIDLLDAYLNFNYDERLQFRIGRWRVPFTYDWGMMSNQFLLTPERSVFAINYGYNRNTAGMVHGTILDGSAEYALAVANGPRNSYFDTNTAKDVMGLFNVRPFEHSSRYSFLKNLNLGVSGTYGIQDNPALPNEFHTSASATTSAGTDLGVPSFLTLNANVMEKGKREMWEMYFAYYYKQWTFQGAVDGGFNTYGFMDGPGSVEVPVTAWHAQFGYFLTGEEIDRRTFVNVKRPFDLREGKRGPGAWEIQARYDRFQLGNAVFTGGLADPSLWTNDVDTIDCGVNWYLNRYVRIQFDWQHCNYGSPVRYAPGRSSDHNDLFWIRFQDYF